MSRGAVDLARALAGLPIEAAIPPLLTALADGRNVVLEAAPGAGKTTGVPLALLGQAWLGRGRILMLEPRRLATRAAARRLASLLGEQVGERVGYRMRAETRVGPATVVEVLTDGVFTRMIQDDPALDGVGAILFDEFHERRLDSDLGLALALEAQGALRPDLRLIAMSATLEAGPLAALMGDAAIVVAGGRAFPVDIRQMAAPANGRLLPAVAETVRRACEEAEGGILVFLPGTAEIRRVQRLLSDDLPEHADLYALYGDLPQAEQDRALRPSLPGRRKIVLATSIAETSLTIDGIAQVVDCGLSRIGRYDPRSGMTRLETVPVSCAGADQRAGRAGRTGPGIAWRLWSDAQHRLLPAQPPPEIAIADLAPLALDLALWGAREAAALPLLDGPPTPAYAAARSLLSDLGALGPDGVITAQGRRMASFPLHPRLAHMALSAAEQEEGRLACLIAAVLGERELEPAARDGDLASRVERVLAGDGPGDLLARIRRTARRLEGLAGAGPAGREPRPGRTGAVLALAYPDRIARRRSEGNARYRLSGGQGAVLDAADPLAAADWLAVADLDGQKPEARIRLAAPLTQGELEEMLAARIVTEERVIFDRQSGVVLARRLRRLGALVLHEAPLAAADPAAVAEALLGGIREAGIEILPWSPAARSLQARVGTLAALDGPEAGWPALDEPALAATLETWLAPALDGRRRLAELKTLDLPALLSSPLSWEQRQSLEKRLPTHITVPSGSRLPVDYSGEVPTLAVRVQELFGLATHPTVDQGRLPLLLALLSPAQRPIQVTRDLPGFWSGSWKAVRADLRGRYPRHPWPEDPVHAEPTARAKRRGE